MNRAYDCMAAWFESLNDDCDYASWSQYFIEGLSALGAGKRGLELGCGSGRFCRLLCRAGYEMSGADLSREMLTEAERRAREEGLSIPFYLADAGSFVSPEKYDFILAPNDVFNYLAPRRLRASFRRLASSLSRGGILWFDVSSPYKLREKVANTVSVDDREEVTYLSFNRFAEGGEDRVEMDVTLFVKREDGSYLRLDERHVQYIHEEADVRAALEGAGLCVLRTEGHLGDPQNRDRIQFICRKN